ncbi:hypothetical protein D6779_10770 [Candidatus Parcubacteria bacterium]|nr:MAG: hypothetical protein D6779_10770 [Candidatus Parcubacteria bacterium]
MKNMKRKKHLSNFRLFLLFFIVTALIFLPQIGKISYTHDDWYLMYAARVRGAVAFRGVFQQDRPLRALILGVGYNLFGENPVYYNLSAYFFRVIGGLGFLWTLRLLWPEKRMEAMWMAFLFVLYPGFLSLPNGIDYQSQMISLAAATLSLALTLEFVLSKNCLVKGISLILSAILAWLYLGLVEYFIGIEVLRVLLVGLVVLRTKIEWTDVMRYIVQKGYILVLSIPLPFIFWRVLIFHSERGATNLRKQFIRLLFDPFQVMKEWIVHLVEDLYNVLFGAWIVPLYQLMDKVNLGMLIWGISLSVLTLLIVFWQNYRFSNTSEAISQIDDSGTTVVERHEMLGLGILGLIACQLPIVMVNRHVIFPAFSRYSLAGSMGAIMVLVVLIYSINRVYIQRVLLFIAVAVAVITHSANASKFVVESKYTNNFWWQVSWRVPQFKKNTTLVVYYPEVGLEENYFIWGPANLIYYPDGTNDRVIQPGIYATILYQDSIIGILSGRGEKFRDRRSMATYPNYNNITIITQPTEHSCIHVIDGQHPEYSSAEQVVVMLLGTRSKMGNVLTDSPFHTPPDVIFGPEPAHGWCFIYQKAELARQKGDWQLVYDLDLEAQQQGLIPHDEIEWMPFLEASAFLGDYKRVTAIASEVASDSFVAQQACRKLQDMELTDSMENLVEEILCTSQ